MRSDHVAGAAPLQVEYRRVPYGHLTLNAPDVASSCLFVVPVVSALPIGNVTTSHVQLDTTSTDVCTTDATFLGIE